MPCDTRLRAGQTISQRKEQVKAALARLEGALSLGQVKVVIGATGSVAFKGWGDAERDGVTDLCAFRRLQAAGSTVLRLALARAEALAGRQIDKHAISSGCHSHDGGHTWGTHSH